jgi:glycosyltransferase involved in cell wall biosynthesis
MKTLRKENNYFTNCDYKVAIVADWITNPGGDDKVIWALHKLFPQAPIYTTIYNPKKMPHYKDAKIHTTYLQKFPFAKTKHQLFVPLMFRALRKFDFKGYDLIISSSHTVGKSITKPNSAVHVCYCHTPLRYIWAPKIDDIRRRIPLGPLTKPLLKFLKKQDIASAKSVDYFIANSHTIAKRIKLAYGKDSQVIYPPVSIEKFIPKRKIDKSNYYITASRLIPYKKIDIIIEAFNKLGKELLVVGIGPEQEKLKAMAKPNIKLLGFVPDEKFVELLQEARAFIFAAYEDFGIVPVEAMAAGTPVIAYGKGGATETVIDNKTGVFFQQQTANAIVDAVKQYEKLNISPVDCIEQSKKFNERIFNSKISKLINSIKIINN